MKHTYKIEIAWSGNTSGYRDYKRDHEISGAGKAAPIAASSDAHFRGDPSRYNPEELLVASLSSCHMLWMLHLCADAGIVVTGYVDRAEGQMRENADGSGEFVSVALRPKISIADAARTADALALNHRAHELCFIARSVNFPVTHACEINEER